MCRTRHHGDKKYGPNCVEKKQAIIARRRSDCTEVQAQFCDYQEMKDPIDIPFGPFGIPVDTYVRRQIDYLLIDEAETAHVVSYWRRLTKELEAHWLRRGAWYKQNGLVDDLIAA
jgi:hypothetical protein